MFSKKVLVTGGAGFIGSNFLHYMIRKYPDYLFINLDCLTYAGNLENLKPFEDSENYIFVRGDITDRKLAYQLVSDEIDFIINFAAESHVDRSITTPDIFVRTNILGTQTLLEAAKEFQVDKFIQISTDEVYGSLGREGRFSEETPLAPNSPYSASKASADLLVRAFYRTYQLPINITRCSNNYGPYQFPEKFIPLFITNALEERELPLYGDGLHIRDWIHVIDHCRAIDLVLHLGEDGEVYNIGANQEMTNLEVTKSILKTLNKPQSLIKFVKDRPGHDRRYAIDSTKIRDLGWQPRFSFEEGIKKTVRWYLTHRDWWNRIKNGVYKDYYQKMYGDR